MKNPKLSKLSETVITYGEDGSSIEIFMPVGDILEITERDPNGNIVKESKSGIYDKISEWDGNRIISEKTTFFFEDESEDILHEYEYDHEGRLVKYRKNGEIIQSIYYIGDIKVNVIEGKPNITIEEFYDNGVIRKREMLNYSGTRIIEIYDNKRRLNIERTYRHSYASEFKTVNVYENSNICLNDEIMSSEEVNYYNENYLIVKSISHTGQEIKYSYDNEGRLISTEMKDTLNSEVKNTDEGEFKTIEKRFYDENGNNIKIEYLDGQYESFEYNDNNLCIKSYRKSISNPSYESVMMKTYDKEKRLVRAEYFSSERV